MNILRRVLSLVVGSCTAMIVFVLKPLSYAIIFAYRILLRTYVSAQPCRSMLSLHHKFSDKDEVAANRSYCIFCYLPNILGEIFTARRKNRVSEWSWSSNRMKKSSSRLIKSWRKNNSALIKTPEFANARQDRPVTSTQDQLGAPERYKCRFVCACTWSVTIGLRQMMVSFYPRNQIEIRGLLPARAITSPAIPVRTENHMVFERSDV